MLDQSRNLVTGYSLLLASSILPISTAFAANPEHLEHPHAAGTFMIEYQYMRMNMDGMRSGTDDIASTEVAKMVMADGLGYMMSPTTMSMDMHMLMPMYNITKDISVMGMLNYTQNKMGMINMSGVKSDMTTSGLGDTGLNVNYKFSDDMFAASLTVSLPTGSIEEKATMMGTEQTAPYPMQLGSGTYDLTPALTYMGAYYDTRFGAQASYTYRAGSNASGYTLGNKANANAWVARSVSKVNLRATVDYNRWGDIEGKDDTIMTNVMGGMMDGTPMAPTAFTNNYGGSNIEAGVKISTAISMVNIGIEYSMPVYQDLNGVQMKGANSIGVNLNTMF